MTEHESSRICLSEDEALVLFEFLSRFCQSDNLTIEDQAEQRVLWDALAQLESQLTSPLRADYEQLLRRARIAVRDPGVE